MDEAPLEAVRRKRRSSLSLGIQQLRDGEADAFITLGNTGALVATAALLLPQLPGIERPALLAQMGTAFCRAVLSIAQPRVGLLNIGEESGKGTAAVRQAYQALESAKQLHFLGNIEGREVFQGRVDLLVTDGFTGNVFLKTSEGVCAFLLEQLLPFASPALRTQLDRFARYVREPSGALLCGVDGLIMKCHGSSKPASLIHTLHNTFDWLQRDLLSAMKHQLLAE
jgi:phosphate acyltransferase